jgi:hypothetical protein
MGLGAPPSEQMSRVPPAAVHSPDDLDSHAMAVMRDVNALSEDGALQALLGSPST